MLHSGSSLAAGGIGCVAFLVAPGGPVDANFNYVLEVAKVIASVAWPLVGLVLVVAYRRWIARILAVVERRIDQGDPFSVFGVSVQGRGAVPLPVAESSPTENPARSAAIAETLSIGANARVLVAIGETAGADESPVIGSGDALGMALVQAALLSLNSVPVTTSTVRSGLSEIKDMFDRFSHVISLGGPRSNPLTNAILVSNYVTFEFRRGGIYDTVEHELKTAEFSPDGRDGTDWALLIVGSNPRRHGVAVVLAGYSGYGTNAAAAVLTQVNNFPDLRGRNSFESLIRVKIEAGQVRDPEVMRVRLLPAVEPLAI